MSSGLETGGRKRMREAAQENLDLDGKLVVTKKSKVDKIHLDTLIGTVEETIQNWSQLSK